jgi:RNA polymerase sigma-70 factor (ECF subfamily)
MNVPMPPDPPDANDIAALFRRHAPFVARFFARLGVRAQGDIDDLVQEVFLVAHRRGGYQPGPATATTWLAEIAVRVLSEARRKRRRHPADLDEGGLDAAEAPQAGPYEAAVQAQGLTRLLEILEGFDLGHRAVFILFEMEGRSCESIAAAFSIPIGTVYSRLNTVREKLRRDYLLRELMDIRPLRSGRQVEERS